nr:type III secretion system cytoplasmic ring protein SctQ [Escherichia coli]
MGFSKTCYRTIVDIEVGDVLLISNNFAYAVIYNTKICDLIYPEELKWLIILSTRKILKQMTLISKSEIEINDENDYQQINSFEDLPVKIEFVLGKKIMNLYEIDDLCAKRIISLLPEAEKNIEIRVNGALTGYGELVEVDDKLGVEIHSWLSGNNNVK